MLSPKALIERLHSLSQGLKKGRENDTARNEALQLSREFTASLSRPEDVVAELIYTVSDSVYSYGTLPSKSFSGPG